MRFGTLLHANGENPKVVQELLRHVSLKVTTDVYMPAVSPQKREAQSKLVKIVFEKDRSKTRLVPQSKALGKIERCHPVAFQKNLRGSLCAVERL